MEYASMSPAALQAEREEQEARYQELCGRGLALDLSRGKPAADQLAIGMPMLGITEYRNGKGIDCRNYGLLEGLPEMRRLFSELTGIAAENILVGGNSSLNMMYDSVARAMLYGVAGSERPWCREERVVFLCPVPGYDRHFRVCESLGIAMLNIPMNGDGPDMDAVEEAVKDPAVKGIWCVPKYSNPTGITYSDEVVRRLCRMKTAAPDFRIFWDNAYAIHDLQEEGDSLLDVFETARAYGNEDRIFYYTSTSKVTFPGAGVAMMAASGNNLGQILPILGSQTIGTDKLNQLRHVLFLRDRETTSAIMRRHAACIRPKFEAMLSVLDRELTGLGIAEWTRPRGGYFISLDVECGCATRVYERCKAAGVTLTGAGATYPYGRDPEDRNLRLAPTYATVEEIRQATEVLCCVIRLTAAEKRVGEA